MMSDILMIVPSRNYDTICRAIRDALWAVESKKKIEFISADFFVSQYGGMEPAQAVAKLRDEYPQVCKLGTLSRREEKAYNAVMDKIIEFAKIEKAAE